MDPGFDVLQSVTQAQGVVWWVLVVLIVMSVVCWIITFYKWISFTLLCRAAKRFSDQYWEADHPNDVVEVAEADPVSIESRVFLAGFEELARIRERAADVKTLGSDFVNVERAVQRTMGLEVVRLERWVSILGTCGSTGPFIGLFGTVWGIMNAIIGLGGGDDGANRLRMVMPDIGEALIATAMGLAVAIPAVMAYNYFVGRIRKMSIEVEGFSSDYINMLRRFFLMR
jgi:biopolymer transport protein TolQ